MATIHIRCADSEQLREHLAVLPQLHSLLGLRSSRTISVSTIYRTAPADTISVTIALTRLERRSPHLDHFVDQVVAYIRLLRPRATVETSLIEAVTKRRQ